MCLEYSIDLIRKKYSHLAGKTFVVGMSGGVDSSVVAVLLKKSGFNVRGVFAECWNEGEQCTAQEDYLDALSVSSRFDIPLDFYDLKDEYRKLVLDEVLFQFQNGMTPNPDIVCNSRLKFGMLHDKARARHGDAIFVTGHYAEVCDCVGSDSRLQRRLLSPKDLSKDQTYFLCRLICTPVLLNVEFPLAYFSKSEVRNLAHALGLPNASKPDSQGICFIGNVNFPDFLSKYIGYQPGNVIDTSGNVIGRHRGVPFYAIGQRHGFELSVYTGDPLYVVSKDIESNLLVVGSRDMSMSSVFVTDEGLFISPESVVHPDLTVRLRNLGDKKSCRLMRRSDNRLTAHLAGPEFGITPGQEAVFYVGRQVVGRATIQQ